MRLSRMCHEGEKLRDRDKNTFLDVLAACNALQLGQNYQLMSGQVALYFSALQQTLAL